MVSFAEQNARLKQTKTFRKKWGGVIHPDYKQGDDLASNEFVGTASQKDVIETLLNGGNSGNLSVWLKENNVNVNDLADVYTASAWKQPIKQTELRAKLAAETQYLQTQQTKQALSNTVLSGINFSNIGQAASRARTSENTTSQATDQTMLEPLPVMEEGRNESLPINNTSPQPATLSKLTIMTDKPDEKITSDKKNYLPLILGITAVSVALFFIIRRIN